jgi:hypothetical protein
MIARPSHLNAYEFAVVAALRAQQLMAGCTPRLCGEHGATTMAQMEVAAGCVARSDGVVTLNGGNYTAYPEQTTPTPLMPK